MKEFTELCKAHTAFERAITSMEERLKEKVEFSFHVDFQPSDGLSLVGTHSSNVARLADCIEIIKRKRKLSEKDFNKICI